MIKRYQIILTGKLLPGFNFGEIQGDIAQLFKIAPEKVPAFLSKPRIVKKDLDAEQAQKFRTKLEKIGLAIKIKPMAEEGSTVALEMQPEKTIEKESPTLDLKKQSNTTLAQEDSPFTLEPKVETPKSNKPDIAELPTDEEDIYELVRPVYDDGQYGIFHTLLDGMNRASIIMGVIVLGIGIWLWAWMISISLKEYLYAFLALGFMVGICIAITGSKGLPSGIFCVLIFIFCVVGGRILVQYQLLGSIDIGATLTFDTFSIIGIILGSLAALKGGSGYGRD